METDLVRSKLRRANSPGRQITSAPAQLPDDLLYYSILSRLPFRLLLRLATVCKAWRHLILHDPVFARVQAQCPSPASGVLARFDRGRLEVLTPGATSAAVAPPDARLSFLPIVDASRQNLQLCSTTSGLLCLILLTTGDSIFFVVNPATRAFRAVLYSGGGGINACLAYDPATSHREGYHLVVPVRQSLELWMFWTFSFSSASAGWRASGANVLLKPFREVHSKPLYLGGLAHWICDHRGDVVWYDSGADAAGKLPPPPQWKKRPSSMLDGGRYTEGNRELVAWHGRVGMVSASPDLLAVWALSSSASGKASPARWEMVHQRSWDEIPGIVSSASCFLWSVVPAGVEVGGEEVLGLALRIGYRQHGRVGGRDDGDGRVWRREVLRYDMRTNGTTAVVELFGREKHDDFVIFGYHSSMAPLY